MDNRDAEKFKNLLKGAYGMFNKPVDAMTAELWWQVLSPYSFDEVAKAFSRCLATSKFAPTPAEVLESMPNALGHPSPEEAWNVVPKTEAESGYVTDEMSQAYAAASSSIERGDYVAGRMGFIESYKKLVTAAKARNKPAKFFYSPGTVGSFEQRRLEQERLTLEAAERGWIEPQRAWKTLSAICDELGRPSAPLLERLRVLPNAKMLLIETGSSGSETRSRPTLAVLNSTKAVGGE